MSEEKRIRLAVIHEILPKEMFVKILKMLDFKSLCIAKGTCQDWKCIIEFLVKEISGKYFIEINITEDFSQKALVWRL